MSAPIVERLREALRTHSLRQDPRGYQIWLGETEVKDAAGTITDLLAALEGMLTGLGPNGYALPAGAVHTAIARAAIAKAKGGAA